MKRLILAVLICLFTTGIAIAEDVEYDPIARSQCVYILDDETQMAAPGVTMTDMIGGKISVYTPEGAFLVELERLRPAYCQNVVQYFSTEQIEQISAWLDAGIDPLQL